MVLWDHTKFIKSNFFTSLAYAASKSGIIGLTKWLATSLAEQNTTCNMITPSGVFNKQNKIFKQLQKTFTF